MVGRQLGHFRIIAKIGEGGMGEVYRAEDTRLGREVALKVLPAAFTSDPDRLARFEREARVLASLSHPAIAQIHEVGEEGDVHFLVMELAAGETLADRLARGPLPLLEALPLAQQIAEALEAAHERGIVHRDLKPANVMVDADGRVKLLDFGLARALEPEPGATPAPQMTRSPTLTYQGTLAGVLLGTAAYMSPEQAAGTPADRRADVWAFGVVLFEMLSGTRLFEGETVSHVLAGVLKDDPSWDALPARLPARLRRLLERCLRKDPRRRLQAIGDARVVLEELARGDVDLGVETEPAAPAPAPPAGASWASWAGWAVAGLAIAALGILTARPWEGAGSARAPAAAPLRAELALPPGREVFLDHQEDVLDLSADGRRIVFVVDSDTATRELALRDLDHLATRILPGTEGAATPAFSPDGEWVAYFANGRLWKTAVAGGAPMLVADAPGQDPRGLTWSSDGYLYGLPDTQTGLLRVRESGGAFEPVTELDEARHERTHRWPHALPGGGAVLFTSDTAESTEFYDDARIEAVRPATGERTVIVDQASRARFLPPDHLVFARGGALYAAPFDPESLEVTGAAAVVLQGVSTTVASGAAHFAVSDTGTLVYLPGAASTGASVPEWVARDGSVEPTSLPAGNYVQLALSPDDRRVAVSSNVGGTQGLWVADLARGTVSRVSFSGSAVDPVWAPDGEWIAYGGPGLVQRVRADGSGEPEVLFEHPGGDVFPSSFSPDGSLLVIDQPAPGGWRALSALRLDGSGELEPLVGAKAAAWMGSVSPDGRWLAYVSLESGSPEVYVRPFPQGSGKWQVSRDSGLEPKWAPDGRELFFRSGIGELYSVPLGPSESFAPGAPVRILGGLRTGNNAASYSIASDGDRILTLGLTGDPDIDRIGLVLDWQREVARIGSGG